MAEKRDKAVRRRVPISCLNCKSRKIKCDKERPCSRCVKHNVAHLCVYVQPSWVEKSAMVATDSLVPSDQTVKFSAELQSTIDAQLKEIERLKTQLVLEQTKNTDLQKILSQSKLDSLSHDGDSSRENSPYRKWPVTILAKLRSSPDPQPSPVILQDEFYTMKGFDNGSQSGIKPKTPSLTALFSWLSIIKIDPQLTALWFRITSMQKSYHIYKTNLLHRYPNGSPSGASPHPNLQSTSLSTVASCGHHKCPVVACEFNLMQEESEPPNPNPSEEKVKLKKEDSSPMPSTGQEPSANGHDMSPSLRSLWEEITGTSNRRPLFNYVQLDFLLSYYFNPDNRMMSLPLLSFFQNEIRSLFKRRASRAQLDVNTDAEEANFYRSKTIYMCLLALIVEETFDSLRTSQNVCPEILAQAARTFPSGFHKWPSTHQLSHVLSHASELCYEMFTFGAASKELSSSLTYIVFLIVFTNRLMSLYERKDISLEVHDLFNKHFSVLLDIVEGGTHPLQLWRNPTIVKFDSLGSPKKNSGNIGLLLCQVWTDFVALINKVAFNMPPLFRHGYHVDENLDSAMSTVNSVSSLGSHEAFLNSLDGSETAKQYNTIAKLLHSQYLVSRCIQMVRNAVNENGPFSLSELRAIESDLCECTDDILGEKLQCMREFELGVILHYLALYMSYIVLLQCEENRDKDSVASVAPSLFQKCSKLSKFLRESCSNFSNSPHRHFVFMVAAECFSRVSHLVAGVLIRFIPETDRHLSTNRENMLVYSFRADHKSTKISVPASRKQELIVEFDSTVKYLESSMNKDAASRCTKIWRFYQTFVRNPQKINPAVYASYHTDAFGTNRLLEKCPIMSNASYQTSALRMEQGPYPVMTTPDTVDEKFRPPAGVCPVTHKTVDAENNVHQMGSASQCPYSSDKVNDEEENHLRGETLNGHVKCPFGHDLSVSGPHKVQRKRVACSEDDDYDSKRRDHRGGTRACQSILMGQIPNCTPPLRPPSTRPNPSNSPMPSSVIPLSPADDLDWDSLPNFDFGMMEDEALMMSVNARDFNDSPESFFQ